MIYPLEGRISTSIIQNSSVQEICLFSPIYLFISLITYFYQYGIWIFTLYFGYLCIFLLKLFQFEPLKILSLAPMSFWHLVYTYFFISKDFIGLPEPFGFFQDSFVLSSVFCSFYMIFLGVDFFDIYPVYCSLTSLIYVWCLSLVLKYP